jgi:hypothetical protein
VRLVPVSLLSALLLSSTVAIAQTGFTLQTYPSFPGDNTVLSADFNHDGHPDLLTYGSSSSYNNFHLYLNNGSGGFGSPVTFPNNNLGTISFAKVGDVNGDGFPDIVAVQGTSLVVYLNDGTGNFNATVQQPAPTGVAGMVIGDVNLDGHLDVILDSSIQVPSTDPNGPAYTVQNSLETYFGDGTGKFGTPVTQSNIDLDIPSIYLDNGCGITDITGGDFFLDNQLSLFVVSNCLLNSPYPGVAGTFSLAQSDGTGHFVFSSPTSQNGGAILATTVDAGQNGTPDVVYAGDGSYGYSYESFMQGVNSGSDVVSYSQIGTNPTFDGYHGIAVADFNGDGIPDLLTTQYDDSPTGGGYPGPALVSLYTGSAAGTFAPSQTITVGGQYTAIGGVAAADFNGDGLTDFATLVVDESSGNASTYTTQLYVYSASTTCTAPTTANSNVICTPANSKTVTAPVAVTAASNVAGLTLNRLYLDNVNVYQTTAATVSTPLTASSGSHRLVLVSYNNQGQAFTSTSTFTVAATPTSCYPGNNTNVAICSPTVGATTSSPVTITALASAVAGNITAVRAYIDNNAVFTVNNPTASSSQQVSQSVAVGPGSHKLVVIGYQSNGGYVEQSETFTVVGSAPCYSSSAGASICSPTSGSTTASPFTVTAGATAGSGYITALRVYVDSVEKTQINNPQKSKSFAIDPSITAATGKHSIVVVGYQSTGGSVSASTTVTVQ